MPSQSEKHTLFQAKMVEIYVLFQTKTTPFEASQYSPSRYQLYPKRQSWCKRKFGIEIAMLASGESYANYSMAFTEASAKLYNHCFHYSLRLVDLA